MDRTLPGVGFPHVDQFDRRHLLTVDPVGKVDPTFFEAARRHILKYWRYTPATENGQAVATSTTVSLDFQLDG